LNTWGSVLVLVPNSSVFLAALLSDFPSLEASPMISMISLRLIQRPLSRSVPEGATTARSTTSPSPSRLHAFPRFSASDG
jgi:hypothetical protein